MPAPDRFRSAVSGNGIPAPALHGVRRQSSYEYLGLPLWSIATGPDPARGEIRGHAKGVLALGDIATGGAAVGWVAIGGLALGIYAVGGIAWGTYIISAMERSPEAIAFFTQFDALRAFIPPPRR